MKNINKTECIGSCTGNSSFNDSFLSEVGG